MTLDELIEQDRQTPEHLTLTPTHELSCAHCGGRYMPAYGAYPPEIIMGSVQHFLRTHAHCQPGEQERDEKRLLGGVKTAMEIRVMDPCMGTGMFLTEAFRMLVPMRMHEEGLPEWVAAELVIRDNLFGLDIDGRCVQLAEFALWFEAAKLGAWGMTHKRREEKQGEGEE